MINVPETSSSLFDPSAVPQEIRLNAGRDELVVTWDDGRPHTFRASALRTACRCAWCTRARAEERLPTGFPGIAITSLSPIADYALNLHFSDGHERGIYPFSYLRALAGADLAEHRP